MYQRLTQRIGTETEQSELLLPLDLVKKHVIVQHNYDDDVLIHYRDSALQYIEDRTRRTLLLTRYQVGFETVCPAMEFRLPPIRAVGKVTYEVGDVENVIPDTAYRLKLGYENGRLIIKDSWPSDAKYIEVEVIAGYGVYTPDLGYPYQYPQPYGLSASDIEELPLPLKQAALLTIGHWYANRESAVIGTTASTVPQAVESLLFKYRNYRA